VHDLANERVAHSQHRDALSLGDYLRVVRRRRLTIALVTVVSVLATYAYTQHQIVLYQSQAGVLLSRQSLVTAITGVVDPTSNAQPDRVAQTQADVARSPKVAQAVLAQLTPKYPQLAHWTPGQVLAATTAAPESGADLLIFQATNHNPSLARDLVNAYAFQYTKYREALDNDAVKTAIVRIQSTLATTTSKTLVQKLQQKMQDLLTIASLQSGNTRLVTPAEGASQIQPKTFRTVLLGLGFGLIFGVVLAFAREALDTRVRTDSEVAALLDLPVLARLAVPPRALRKRDSLVMLAATTEPAAEAFRILRTNLDFANLRTHAQTIMITSALEKEGKSTTLANLALAFTQTGRRVCIVDLDLRRPYLDRFFGTPREPGFTNVALGQVTVDEVLHEVDLSRMPGLSRTSESSDRARVSTIGTLHIVAGGLQPPDPADILDSEVLETFLASLKHRFDIILIDTPPLLPVSDGMIISRRVDAMLVVVRLVMAKRSTLAEFRRVLSLSPAHRLGFVETGAPHSQAYGYGSYGGYASSPPASPNGSHKAKDPLESSQAAGP
jgi:succinoglycan biosynthesis transport protein ExoP